MAKKLDFRLLLDRLSQISFDFGTIQRYAWVLHLFIIFIAAKSSSDIAVSFLDNKLSAPAAVRAKKGERPSLGRIASPSLEEFNPIVQRQLFNPKAKPQDLVDRAKKDPVLGGLDEEGATPSSLPLELVGTIILSDQERSVAAIKNKSKNELESYQANDMITPDAKVYKVKANKVFLQNLKTGRLEFIEQKEERASTAKKSFQPRSGPSRTGEGIRKAGDDKFIIDRSMLESALSNPNEILTQARAVPNLVGGKIDGFRIFSIKPGSVYEKLGIKNGDIVKRINGVVLDSPAKALEFYGAISSASDVSIDLERGGQRQSLSYTITN